MSIFQKYCPECSAPNATDTISCNCGYCFDPEALAASNPSAYADQQDHLYRDYLAARIVQAESELVVAREQANAEPGNTYKASGALLAEQALNALQAEMRQLSSRISTAPPARRPAIVARPIAHTPPARKVVATVTAVARPNAPLTPKAASPRAAAAKPIALKSITPAPRRLPAKPIAKPSVVAAKPKPPIWRSAPKSAAPKKSPNPLVAFARKAKSIAIGRAAPAKQKSAEPLPRKIAPVAPPAVPRAPSRPATVVARQPANSPHRPAVPSVTNRPDENFRRLQSEKAEAIARAKASPASAKPTPVAKAPVSVKPSADIPPALLRNQAPTQDCPNCTASVAATLTRCSCGYVLSSPGEAVPAVALDATALAILTEGVSFNSSNRRR